MSKLSLKILSTGIILPTLYYVRKHLMQEPSFAEEQVKQQGNYFKCSYSLIPHYKKRARGGEDAYICEKDVLAVADGVGGWASKGVDPGIFARELCSHVYNEFKQARESGKRLGEINLIEIFVEGVKKTKPMGSSTFVMAALDENGDNVSTLNYGDSGVMIIRPQADESLSVVFKSKEMQYQFNFPYQVGTNCDLPYDADVKHHQIQHNDILILGSDGLFDNLYEADILECIKPEVNKVNNDMDNINAASFCIAKKAEDMSYNKNYVSPFAKGAVEAGRYYHGGKPDDITVVIGQCKLNQIL